VKKVGIYSGTFDPVHAGHVAFAHEALEQCGLDKVFFLVEPRPRRKQGVKALEHRAKMVRLAIADESQLGSITLEQQRFTAVDTLPILQRRFKGAELYMLMGDDMLAHFAEWPHVEELIQGIQFVIGVRNYSEVEIERRLGSIQKARGLKIRYMLFQAPSPAFSSSLVKQQIKKGQMPKGLTPEVLAYIKEQGLYAEVDSSMRS
jgi:nicotinate-nucleotide adenylyltransferase